MPTDGRDNGKAERERESMLSDAELVVREEAAILEELTDSLDSLRQLLHRIEQWS